MIINKITEYKTMEKFNEGKIALTLDLPFPLACSLEDEPMLSSLSSELNCCEFMELFEPNSSKRLQVNVCGADKFTLTA